MNTQLINEQIKTLLTDSNLPIPNFEQVSRLKNKLGENILHLIVKTNDYTSIKNIIDSAKLLPLDEQVIFFTSRDKKYGYTPLHTYYNYVIDNNLKNKNSIQIMELLMENIPNNIEDYRGNKIQKTT
jgi:hypothetical protein